MAIRSMTEIAFEVLSSTENPLPFNTIWERVCKEMAYNETQAINKIAAFYSALTLDNRFLALVDNQWDLKSRHTYDEAHVDISSIEVGDDFDDDFYEDDETEFDDEITEIVEKEE